MRRVKFPAGWSHEFEKFINELQTKCDFKIDYLYVTSESIFENKFESTENLEAIGYLRNVTNWLSKGEHTPENTRPDRIALHPLISHHTIADSLQISKAHTRWKFTKVFKSKRHDQPSVHVPLPIIIGKK